jgi:hypothetical protein
MLCSSYSIARWLTPSAANTSRKVAGVRGGLDDALERLARRDQLRKRVAPSDGPSGDNGSHGANGAHGDNGSHGGIGSSGAIGEVVEAVRRIVERHPELSVTVYGEEGEVSAEIRIARREGVVEATVVAAEGPISATASVPGPPPALPGPPAWPLPTDSNPGAAARLAELIRQDPSLLTGPEER